MADPRHKRARMAAEQAANKILHDAALRAEVRRLLEVRALTDKRAAAMLQQLNASEKRTAPPAP